MIGDMTLGMNSSQSLGPVIEHEPNDYVLMYFTTFMEKEGNRKELKEARMKERKKRGKKQKITSRGRNNFQKP